MSSSSIPLYPSSLQTPTPPQNITTPPPPPQDNNPLGEQVLNRKIFEPVPPTKPVALIAANLVATGHPYEVEETPPARARGDFYGTTTTRASMAYSGIDSIASNFQEGAEKKMAKSIQVYIQSTISEFAAADTLPIGTKNLKRETTSKENSFTKVMLPNKPIIVANLLKTLVEKTKHGNIQVKNHPSSISPNMEKSLSTVIRNEYKKARVTTKPTLQTT
ncbi:hypothetical protein EPUL_006127 [Erysiphe pulchra]|uniref:Uncharacterized protein n=1 Tax=Erysiphe pulchra TaxID=225359 RepID=A0A2S4PJJ8_9PEZI|nr:hypothetical protein EPUL_006127 [Erysiphe pulchra]